MTTLHIGEETTVYQESTKEFSFVTQHNTHELTYDWMLENFSPTLFKNQEIIESPIFPVTNVIEATLWSIKMYFRKREIDNVEKGSEIGFSLISHLSCEELMNYMPKLIISFFIKDDSDVPIYLLPPTEVKFDGKAQEIEFHKIESKSTSDPNDYFYKFFNLDYRYIIIDFECRLLTHIRLNMQQDCLKSILKKVVWKIDKFKSFIEMSHTNDGLQIESLKFDFLNDANLCINSDDLFETRDPNILHKWSVNLYPHGRDDRFKDHMSIFLKHMSGPPIQAVVEFKIEGHKSELTVMLPQQLFQTGKRWGVGEYVELDDFDFRFGNLIKITCKIKLIHFRTTFIDNSNLINYANKNSLFFLKKLFLAYKAGRFYDYKLRSEDGWSIKLHKTVLNAASNKFEEINRIDTMANNPNNKHFVVQFNGDGDGLPFVPMEYSKFVVKNFAKYLYKHALDRDYSLEDLINLLILAFDFDVEKLRNDCLDAIIKSHINNDTFFKLIKLNDRYLNYNFKIALASHLKRNYYQLCESNEWTQAFYDGHLKDILAIFISE